MSFLTAQLQNFSLYGSGVSIGDTTLTLSSFQTIDGVNLSMVSFGSEGYITCEPGSKDREEQIGFTGIIQNSNGTSTLTGIKSVLFISPYTETAGFSKSHPGGVVAVVSNTSGFYNKFAIKDNNDTITAYWNVPDPLAPTNVANKEYVDALVNGGAVTTNALIEVGTAGETITQGQVVYLKASDGRWYKSLATTSATVDNIQLGITQGSATAGIVIPGGVLRKGIDTHQTGGAAGSIGYISNTSSITTSAGTIERAIGNFITTTTFDFNPEYYYVPTAIQKSYIVKLSTYTLGYAADGGSTDDYAITLSPAPTSYIAGMAFVFKANTANTEAATLNVNSLGAVAIKKNFNSALATGDILAGQIIEVVYDGTNFQMTSSIASTFSVASGSLSHDLSSATSNVIPHGLPNTPKLVRVVGQYSNIAGTPALIFVSANSVFSGGVQSSTSFNLRNGDTTAATGTLTQTFRLGIGNTGSDWLEGVISVDATNITIAWTKTGSPTGIANFIWDAIA